MAEDRTPRQRLIDVTGLNEGSSRYYLLVEELDRYRDALLAHWQETGSGPVYCPFDCDRCHDDDECPCPNCTRNREEWEEGTDAGADA